MSNDSGFWSVVEPFIEADAARQVDSLADEVEAYFGGPRDLGSARKFLKERLPPGRIYVYGAGSHSEAIVHVLTGRRDLEILGFVDQAAARLGTFHGFEVLTPEALAGRDFDYVLISYNRMEMKLIDRLLDLGIPRDRIRPIYSDPDFIRQATDAEFAKIERQLKGHRFDHVIVRSAIHEVIPDAALATVFPPDRTLVLHAGPAKPSPLSAHFWTIDVRECAALIASILRALRPSIVFLSTAQEYDLLYFAVRRAAPDSRLIHEIYDFFPFIPDDWIKLGINASDRLIQLMRLSNYHSTRGSELVVSKRAGAAWDVVRASFETPYQYVFPGIGSPEELAQLDCGDHVAADDRVRILYAGALVPSHFHVYKRSDYNFLPMLEEMVARGRVAVDIYNSGHGYAVQDGSFQDYLDRYAAPPMTYHRRIPFENLVRLMTRHDYGWLCLAPRERRLADQQVVICNRFSAYIYGGLPVIVDSEWDFIADLVETFDAGLVIRDADPDRVLAAIASCDYAAKRAGVMRLRAHLWAHNEKVRRALIDFRDERAPDFETADDCLRRDSRSYK